MSHVDRASHHAHKLYKRLVAFNTAAALRVTASIGSMWCAYVFVVLALLGFPGFHATPPQYVQWVSQTFIQLVALSIIMVGQTVQNEAGERRHHAQEMRLERMEREHGDELKALHALIADLHSHTTCAGHTTIETVRPPKATTPRKRAASQV
jgi:hypothetical protein